MAARHILALILRAIIYLAFQYLAYKIYILPGLVVAWVMIIVTTWLGAKTVAAKVSQTVVQTAWFIFILAVIHAQQITI